MKTPELLSTGGIRSEAPVIVPGIERAMEDLRAAYPSLSEGTIRRILRLPPEIRGGKEPSREA